MPRFLGFCSGGSFHTTFCDSHLLLHNKLPQNLVAEDSCCWFSPRCPGSALGAALSWVALLLRPAGPSCISVRGRFALWWLIQGGITHMPAGWFQLGGRGMGHVPLLSETAFSTWRLQDARSRRRGQTALAGTFQVSARVTFAPVPLAVQV